MLIWNKNMQGLMPGLALCDSVCQAPAATTCRRQGGTPAEIALGGLQRCAMPGQSGMPVTLNRPPTEASRCVQMRLSASRPPALPTESQRQALEHESKRADALVPVEHVRAEEAVGVPHARRAVRARARQQAARRVRYQVRNGAAVAAPRPQRHGRRGLSCAPRTSACGKPLLKFLLLVPLWPATPR